MRPKNYLFLAFVLLLQGLNPKVTLAEDLNSIDIAQEYLISKIAAQGMYNDLRCLSFESEGTEEGLYLFAVRENHTKGCGGDPLVSPIRDRFRVSINGTIEKYDPVEDS